MTLQRELILLGARHVKTRCDALGAQPHVLVPERAPEPIVDDAVLDPGVAESIALPRLRKHVWRIRHRLHPTGHEEVAVARTNRLRREHHGLQTGAADFVDRRGRYALR